MSINNQPLVTVYIPTHNRQHMILRAVNSVLNQTYTNIEIIVVDDGSTDETESILSDLASKGSIKYFRINNPRGACAARNLAIQHAQGELITGLDDDDIFRLNRVEELVNAFQTRNASCIGTGITERSNNGDIDRAFVSGEITLSMLLHHNWLGNQVLTKTRYLKDIDGFDEDMPSFQDYDTWVRLVSTFGRAYKLDTCSYIMHTEHGDTRITTSSNGKLTGFELFVSKHKQKMSPSHLKTFEIMRKRLYCHPYSLVDFILLTNTNNWRQSVTLLLQRTLPQVNKIIRNFRQKG